MARKKTIFTRRIIARFDIPFSNLIAIPREWREKTIFKKKRIFHSTATLKFDRSWKEEEEEEIFTADDKSARFEFARFWDGGKIDFHRK